MGACEGEVACDVVKKGGWWLKVVESNDLTSGVEIKG